MHSDTESLAFVEEEATPSPPQRQQTNVPPAPVAAPRPRIMAMPRLQTPSPPPATKPTPTKPPLHTSPSPAPGQPSRSAPAAAAYAKAAKADSGAENSDNDSIFFAVENGLVAGTPMRSAMPPPPVPRPHNAPLPVSQAAVAQRRLRRTGSAGSIQFHSEPGSRTTSPGPNPRVGVRGGTPAEKSSAPGGPSSGGRRTATTDDSISFMEHPGGSEELDYSPPLRSNTSRQTTAAAMKLATPPARPLLTGAAAAVAAAAGHSSVTNDSIAFQVEDDSESVQNRSTTGAAPAAAAPRSVVPVSGANIPARPRGRARSIAESSIGEFVDNGSIAFMVEDDAADAKVPGRRGSLTSPAKRDTGTPKMHALQRSHTASSRPASRPLSPSIQFEMENTDNESVVDQSSRHGAIHVSPPLSAQRLPVFGDDGSPTTATLLIPDLNGRSPNATLNSALGGADTAASAASSQQPTKKTIVMNRLQQQQLKPHASRLPHSGKQVTPPRGAAHALHAAGELSPSRSATHPPLYIPAVVSTPLAAQAAGAPSVSSTGGSRKGVRPANLPKKKSARALHKDLPYRRRPGESLQSLTEELSPRIRPTTEVDSTDSTESPPEPLMTGRRSHTSTEIPAVGRSPVQPTQRSFPRTGSGSFSPRHQQHPHHHQRQDSNANTVQGYLANQEAENQYHRRHSSVAHGREHHEGHASGAHEEAEQWRQFNEQQRAELAELRRRIAVARRLDRTLLESEVRHDRGAALVPAPQPVSKVAAPRGGGSGYSSVSPRPRGAAPGPSAPAYGARMAGSRAAPTTTPRGTSPRTYGASSGRIASSQSGNSLHPAASCPPAPSTALRSSQASRRSPLRAPPQPMRAPAPSASHAVNIVQSTAAASVADLLGILWPPRMTATFVSNGVPPIDLYFVNGSRLTPEQVGRFFELVHAELAAEAARQTSRAPSQSPPASARRTMSASKLRQRDGGGGGMYGGAAAAAARGEALYADPAELEVRGLSSAPSRSAGREARPRPLSAKLAALLPKTVVRRSRVLREVFDVMDLKRQGALTLGYLPTLARLFEGELVTLETARASLLHGRVEPLQTLLESAVTGRRLHAAAWTGSRSAGQVSPSRFNAGEPADRDDEDGMGTSEVQRQLAYLTHRLLLLSFAVNVVIPIAAASRIPHLDFPTLCIIVYAAIDNVDHAMDSPQEEWRQVVQQYFIALSASS